jgi:NAD(P)H-hydrate repair Nnr-like enzyme with NAD(P)H-hydrate dehydratase domain
MAARNRSELWISPDGLVVGKAMNAQTPGLQQRGRRAMEFFCGLDLGMDDTAICVVDDKGKVMLQVAVVTDPDAIKLGLQSYLGRMHEFEWNRSEKRRKAV